MSILRCSQTVDESSLLEGTGTITQCFSNKRKNLFTVFLQGDFQDFYSVFYIQRRFIYRPSDSTVSENAGIEPRSVAISALAVRGSNESNHSARCHPRLGQISSTQFFTVTLFATSNVHIPVHLTFRAVVPFKRKKKNILMDYMKLKISVFFFTLLLETRNVTLERSSVMLSFIFWTRVTTSQVLCTSCRHEIVYNCHFLHRVSLVLVLNQLCWKMSGLRSSDGFAIFWEG